MPKSRITNIVDPAEIEQKKNDPLLNPNFTIEVGGEPIIGSPAVNPYERILDRQFEIIIDQMRPPTRDEIADKFGTGEHGLLNAEGTDIKDEYKRSNFIHQNINEARQEGLDELLKRKGLDIKIRDTKAVSTTEPPAISDEQKEELRFANFEPNVTDPKAKKIIKEIGKMIANESSDVEGWGLESGNFIDIMVNNSMTNSWYKMFTGENMAGSSLMSKLNYETDGLYYDDKKLDVGNWGKEEQYIINGFMQRKSQIADNPTFWQNVAVTASSLAFDLPLIVAAGQASGFAISKMPLLGNLLRTSSIATRPFARIWGNLIQNVATFQTIGIPGIIKSDDPFKEMFLNAQMGVLATAGGWLGTWVGKGSKYLPGAGATFRRHPGLRDELGGLFGSFGFGYGSTKFHGGTDEDAIATGLAFAATHFTNPSAMKRAFGSMKEDRLMQLRPTAEEMQTGKFNTVEYYLEGKDGKLSHIDREVWMGEGKIVESGSYTNKTEDFIYLHEHPSKVSIGFGQAYNLARIEELSQRSYKWLRKELGKKYTEENQTEVMETSRQIATALIAGKAERGFVRNLLPKDLELNKKIHEIIEETNLSYNDIDKFIRQNVLDYIEKPEQYRSIGNERFTEALDILKGNWAKAITTGINKAEIELLKDKLKAQVSTSDLTDKLKITPEGSYVIDGKTYNTTKDIPAEVLKKAKVTEKDIQQLEEQAKVKKNTAKPLNKPPVFGQGKTPTQQGLEKPADVEGNKVESPEKPVTADYTEIAKGIKPRSGEQILQEMIEEGRVKRVENMAEEIQKAIRREKTRMQKEANKSEPEPAETLKQPAVRTKSGKIFTGKNHGFAQQKAEASGESKTFADVESGWVTSTGRFITDLEAKKIAGTARSEWVGTDIRGVDNKGFRLNAKGERLDDVGGKAEEVQRDSEGNKIIGKLPTAEEANKLGYAVKTVFIDTKTGKRYINEGAHGSSDKVAKAMGLTNDQFVEKRASGEIESGFINRRGEVFTEKEAQKIFDREAEIAKEELGKSEYAEPATKLPETVKPVEPKKITTKENKTKEFEQRIINEMREHSKLTDKELLDKVRKLKDGDKGSTSLFFEVDRRVSEGIVKDLQTEIDLKMALDTYPAFDLQVPSDAFKNRNPKTTDLESGEGSTFGTFPAFTLKDIPSNIKENTEVFRNLSKIGWNLVRKGFKTFKTWSAQMMKDLGQGVKNILRRVWAGIKPYITGDKAILDPNALFNVGSFKFAQSLKSETKEQTQAKTGSNTALKDRPKEVRDAVKEMSDKLGQKKYRQKKDNQFITDEAQKFVKAVRDYMKKGKEKIEKRIKTIEDLIKNGADPSKPREYKDKQGITRTMQVSLATELDILQTFGNIKRKTNEEILDARKRLNEYIEGAYNERQGQIREQAQLEAEGADLVIGSAGGTVSQHKHRERQLEAGDLLNRKPLRHFIRGVLQNNLTGGALFDYLDQTLHKPFEGKLYNKFFRPIKEGRRSYNENILKFNRDIEQLKADIWGLDIKNVSSAERIINLNKMKRLENKLKYKVKSGVKLTDGTELIMSKMEAARHYLLLKDPALRETFVSNKWNMETAEADLKKFMGDELVKYADSVQKIFTDLYPSINKVFQKVYNSTLPFNPYYSGKINRIVEPEPIEENLMNPFERAFVTMYKQQFKERVDSVADIKLEDLDVVLTKHVTDMEHFKAFAEITKTLRGVFDNLSVKTAIEQNFGPKMNQIMRDYIDDLIAGNALRKKQVGWLDTVRSNFTKAVIGGNPVVFAKQLTSIPAYAFDIPVKDFLSGISDFLRNPIENYKTLMESPVMQARASIGFERDLQNAIKRAQPSGARSFTSLTNMLLITTKLGDRAAIVLGGWGNYKYHYNRFVKEGMLHEEAHQKALREFELATERSQQAGNVEDLPALMRTGSLGKLFTMFMTAPNQYFNQVSASIRGLYRNGEVVKQLKKVAQETGDYKMLEQAQAQLQVSRVDAVKRIAIGHFLLPMLFQFVASGFKWDDKRQLRAAVVGSLNGLLIAGEWMEAGFDALNNDWNYEPEMMPVVSSLNEIYGGFKQLGGVLEKDDITFEDVFEVGATFGEGASKIAGIPLTTLKRITEGNISFWSGKYDNILATAGWSKWALEGSRITKEDLKDIRKDAIESGDYEQYLMAYETYKRQQKLRKGEM